MRTNALTRAPFNARDRQRLQRMVRPGDPVPLLQRGGLNERIGAILGPNALKDPKNPKDQADFLMRLAADFVPVRTRDDDDGRPDDADPNDGDDSDDDNATGGRGVREGLGFDLTPIPVPELVPYTRLDFRVEEVVCLDTTNGESGRDEISISGAFLGVPRDGLDTATNDLRGVLPIDAIGQFRDGTVYRNVRDPYASFDLSTATMPHAAMVFFAMAETDPAGGFETFVNALDLEVRNLTGFNESEAMPYIIAMALGPIAAFGVGAGLGFAIGGPPGAAVGAIVGLVAGIVIMITSVLGLFGVLDFSNNDEIFGLEEASVILNPRSLQGFPFRGSTRSETQRLLLEGDGGTYEVTYHWRLRNRRPEVTEDQDPPVIEVTLQGGS